MFEKISSEKFTVTGVSTLSHCDQRLIMENDDARVEISIKKQANFFAERDVKGMKVHLFPRRLKMPRLNLNFIYIHFFKLFS